MNKLRIDFFLKIIKKKQYFFSKKRMTYEKVSSFAKDLTEAIGGELIHVRSTAKVDERRANSHDLNDNAEEGEQKEYILIGIKLQDHNLIFGCPGGGCYPHWYLYDRDSYFDIIDDNSTRWMNHDVKIIGPHVGLFPFNHYHMLSYIYDTQQKLTKYQLETIIDFSMKIDFIQVRNQEFKIVERKLVTEFKYFYN